MRDPFDRRGRGTPENPSNRFTKIGLEICGDHKDALVDDGIGDGLRIDTEVTIDRTKSVLNEIDSPDLPFRWTLNPYRGCEHGCAYCYARPDHERLGYSAGLDFETKIVAKTDAAYLLRRELRHRSWRGEAIALAGATDAWQPIERKLRITRGCLEVLVEARQATMVITKNRLIERDIDLLCELHAHRAVGVAVSLTTLDAGLARALEPRASTPADRLAAVRSMSSAGLSVQAMIAPVIPGLNDHEIPALLAAAKDAGAESAGWVLLRLPRGLPELFAAWLERHLPLRKDRVLSALRSCRDGILDDSAFTARMRGRGPRAESIRSLFAAQARRLGLRTEFIRGAVDESAFRPPRAVTRDGAEQLQLDFGDSD